MRHHIEFRRQLAKLLIPMACFFTAFVLLLSESVEAAPSRPIFVSTTVDRGSSDPLLTANRLAGVTIAVYVDGVLTNSGQTSTLPPGGSTEADQFGTADEGQQVIACVDGNVTGYSFDAVTLNTGLTDPTGAGRPCGGVSTVLSNFNFVTTSFNFNSDKAIYVSATVDRGPSDSLISATRLTGVPIEVYLNGVLDNSGLTTSLPPGGSTQADQFGFVSVGDQVIVCVAGEVSGYSFDAVTLNTGLTDPTGAGRPCGGVSTVLSNFNFVTTSFNFNTIIPLGTAFGQGAVANVEGSAAFGEDALATAENSTSVGSSAAAEAEGGIAIGHNSLVSDTHIGGIAIGSDGDDAGDDSNTVGATADGSGAIAIGVDSLAGNDRSIAIGQRASSGTGVNGIAIGFDVEVSGNNSSSVGFSSSATGSSATAIGAGANAAGNNSTALGRLASATAPGAFAAGLRADASAQSASAIGADSVASGIGATAIGRNAQATATSAVAIGRDTVSNVANRITLGAVGSTIQFGGLAGAGTRSLAVDANGIVFTVPSTSTIALASKSTAAKVVSPTYNGISSLNSVNDQMLEIETSLTKQVSEIDRSMAGIKQRLSNPKNGDFSSVLLTQEMLENAGFDSYDASLALQAHETSIMERLILRNRAVRGDWLYSSLYDSSLNTIRSNLREELGELGYDRYLISLEQPNRVYVQRVISDSSAAEAGMEPGDGIVQYNGKRIFGTAQLQFALDQSQGDSIDLIVLREGKKLTLNTISGPLGISVYNDHSAFPSGICEGCGEFL